MAKHTVKRKYMEATTEDRDAEFICSMIETKIRVAVPESSECYDAKAMLLFGNSLFPDNFRMKLQSYQMAKAGKDVEKAAQLFRAMYISFPNEQSFYSELCAIIEEVRTEQKSTNTEMFQRLSKSLQCEILLKFCPTFSNILDEIGLKVFIMRNYPLTIRAHAFDVIETLAGLERESYPTDPLNVYRERLVCDILPLVFHQMTKKKEMDSHVAAELLAKAVSFHLSYGLLRVAEGRAPLVHGSVGEHPRLKDPWLSLRQLLEAVSSYHSWSGLGLPRLPRPPGTSGAGQQSTEEFVLGLDQVLLSARSPSRFTLPLLVAHIEVTAGYLHRTKASFFAGGSARAKAADSTPVRPDLWMCSFGVTNDDLKVTDPDDSALVEASHWFGLALKVWRHLGRLNKEGRKELDELMRSYRSEAWQWLQLFYAEAVVLHNPTGLKECAVSAERVAALSPLPVRLFLESMTAWEAQRPSAVTKLILCLQTLKSASPGADFPLASDLRLPCLNRPHAVNLSFAWLFNFVIAQLLQALQVVCRRVTAWNHKAVGHALVLLQWDLGCPETAERRLEFLTFLITMIRQVGSLEYPRFFDYIINLEVLEEIVVLQTNPTRPVRLMLSPEMTASEDKAQEELVKRSQLQIEKSHNTLGPLIFDFLVAETESFAECFS